MKTKSKPADASSRGSSGLRRRFTSLPMTVWPAFNARLTALVRIEFLYLWIHGYDDTPGGSTAAHELKGVVNGFQRKTARHHRLEHASLEQREGHDRILVVSVAAADQLEFTLGKRDRIDLGKFVFFTDHEN